MPKMPEMPEIPSIPSTIEEIKEIFDKDYFAGLPVDYRKVSVRIKTCGPAAEPKTKSTPSPSTSASTPPSTPPPPKPRYIYKPFNSLAEKVLF